MAAAPTDSAAQIVTMREMLDKWGDLQKALAKEKSEAKEANLILQQRIELLTRELEELKAKKVKGELDITEADKKKSELVDKKTAIVNALADLEREAPILEGELRALQPMLPDPVKEKLAPLFSRIPEADKPSKASLAERYQNVVGILNEAGKSNQEISVVSEIRTLDDGKPAEVKTLYIGLGQAYFVNATGKKGGIGRPGPQGWVWQQDDSLAADVRLSIAMLQSKSTAKFIRMPVQID
ncbi:MAG: DUF3450 family protein [Opitutaceae bacterium]